MLDVFVLFDVMLVDGCWFGQSFSKTLYFISVSDFSVFTLSIVIGLGKFLLLLYLFILAVLLVRVCCSGTFCLLSIDNVAYFPIFPFSVENFYLVFPLMLHVKLRLFFCISYGTGVVVEFSLCILCFSIFLKPFITNKLIDFHLLLY